MSLPQYARYVDSGLERIGQLPSHWRLMALKRVATFSYGDALPQDRRTDTGDVPVFGSNGELGRHDSANTSAPAIFVGRKGSYGALNWSDVPSFGIDTVYFVDARQCAAHLRWLCWGLHILGLNAISQDTGVPGLSREVAYQQQIPLPSAEEQASIASFLDRETAKIDALVRNSDG